MSQGCRVSPLSRGPSALSAYLDPNASKTRVSRWKSDICFELAQHKQAVGRIPEARQRPLSPCILECPTLLLDALSHGLHLRQLHDCAHDQRSRGQRKAASVPGQRWTHCRVRRIFPSSVSSHPVSFWMERKKSSRSGQISTPALRPGASVGSPISDLTSNPGQPSPSNTLNPGSRLSQHMPDEQI